MDETKNPPLFVTMRDGNGCAIDYYTKVTLRDLFAAAALQGILASPQSVWTKFEEISRSAYEQADSMLGERHE